MRTYNVYRFYLILKPCEPLNRYVACFIQLTVQYSFILSEPFQNRKGKLYILLLGNFDSQCANFLTNIFATCKRATNTYCMHLSNLDYRVVSCIFSLVYLLDQNECSMKVNKKIKATELCLYIKSPV